MDEYRMKPGKLRILLPGRVGTVEIDTTLTHYDGAPRVRVDVTSDSDRYGPADDGRNYTVENGDPDPGVVFLTAILPGEESKPEPDNEGYVGEAAYRSINGLIP